MSYVKEVLDLIDGIDNVEDLDTLAYVIRKKQEVLINRAKLVKELNS